MATRSNKADQRADYRSKLLAERARATGGIREHLDVLALPSGLAMEDQAPLLHDQFVTLRRHRMDRRKIRMIDAALERLDRGEFGICAECDEPIPAKRLSAVPWAQYCVPCQAQVDSRSDAEPGGGLGMIA
jgi:DnaK suppressor protein